MASTCPSIKLQGGTEIPILGLGTWKSEPGQVYQAVKDAIDAGYRHFDCALIYQNEPEVGKALQEKIAEGKVSRKDLFVTSKCWNTYHKKDRVTKCCEMTLRNLGLDYVDLYLIHWPHGFQEGDNLWPVDEKGDTAYSDVDYVETWEGMEECHRKGWVRSIGLSNFNSEQIKRIMDRAKIKPVMNQVECHPYLNQSKLIDFCGKYDIAITAYSPLGSPDRPFAKEGEPRLLDEPIIKSIAEKHNKSPGQVLIRYQIERNVVVIPKSVTKERIISNFQVFDFKLSPEEMKKIDNLEKNFRYLELPWLRSVKYYPFNIPF